MPEINDKYAGGGPRRTITREELPFTVESWSHNGNPLELLATTCNLLIGHAALDGAAKVRPGVHLTLRNGAQVHRTHGPMDDLKRQRRMDQVAALVRRHIGWGQRQLIEALPAETRAVVDRAIGEAYVAAIRDARGRVLDLHDQQLAAHEPLLLLADTIGMLLEPQLAGDATGNELDAAHEPVETDAAD